MLQFPVIYQLLTAAVLLSAFLALETLLVESEMIIQYDPLTEFLVTKMTMVLVFQFLVSLTMLPFVTTDVDHGLTAETTDLRFRVVSLLHVKSQIRLHFVSTSAVFADELGLVVPGVNAKIMPLNAVSLLELRVADVALEEVVRLMDHFVLLQSSFGLIRFLTHVTFVGLAMNERHVIFNHQSTAEVFTAKRTDVLDLLKDFVHFSIALLAGFRGQLILRFFGGFFGHFQWVLRRRLIKINRCDRVRLFSSCCFLVFVLGRWDHY